MHIYRTTAKPSNIINIITKKKITDFCKDKLKINFIS